MVRFRVRSVSPYRPYRWLRTWWTAAQVHPVDLGVQGDLGAGLPVLLGPVVQGPFVRPVPAARLGGHAGDGEGAFGGGLVRRGLVEDHGKGLPDTDLPPVRGRLERRENRRGRGNRGERRGGRGGQPG